MVVVVFNKCKLKEQKVKELNWFQKVMIKLQLPFVNCWLNFDKNFPKVGQKVQTKMTFDTKSFFLMWDIFAIRNISSIFTNDAHRSCGKNVL